MQVSIRRSLEVRFVLLLISTKTPPRGSLLLETDPCGLPLPNLNVSPTSNPIGILGAQPFHEQARRFDPRETKFNLKDACEYPASIWL